MNRSQGFDGLSRERLEAAIGAARSRLKEMFVPTEISATDGGRPQAGGYWVGELEADTTLESDYIVFLHFLDPEKYREKIRRLALFVLERQLDDGSWNIFFSGPGDLSASVKAYLALRLGGFADDEPALVKAREAIRDLGGAENVNSFTKFYLALLGQLSWDDVPAIPPEVVLLPRFFYINIYEISYWSRAILIPLSILWAKRARRLPAGGMLIGDLFIDPSFAKDPARWKPGSNGNGLSTNGNGSLSGAAGGNGSQHRHAIPDGNGATPLNGDGADGRFSLEPQVDRALFSWESFFTLTDRVLKIVEKAPVKPLRRLALRKAEEWMVSRFEDSDGLGAIFPSMVNSVMALRSLGYAEDHPLILKAMKELEELEIEEDGVVRMQPCLSPVWDTAKAVNALHEAGIPPDDDSIVKACRWLVSKEVRRPGDWQLRVPHVDIGGWYFQFRNEFYPDVDDTAAVLMALNRAATDPIEGIEGSMARGIDWTLNMQCSNGGWAAFDVDVQREVLTKVPYADHNAMLDPSCSDITGRCLELLGRFPGLMEEPRVVEAVRRAVAYMKQSQEEDGSWYGRWGVNYIYGTWQALKGLAAVGEDTGQEYIRRAVRFLKSHQNDDGGWGETCASYADPSLRARGDSTASQTSWALMGLIAAGEARSPEVEKGIRYLLEHQGADGNWAEDYWTGTGFPQVFYLKYHLYRLYFPLFALGMYRNALDGVSTVDPDRGRELLDRIPAAASTAARRRALRSLFAFAEAAKSRAR